MRQHAPHDLVEQQLRVAVDVERPLEFGLFAKRRAAAVDAADDAYSSRTPCAWQASSSVFERGS
jgi:hypothetical protein